MAVRGDNSLFFSTALDNSGLKRGSLDAIGIVSGLAQSIAKINPFIGLAIGAATAFSAVAAQSYKLAKEFETAMLEVQTISKATQEDFQGIGDAIFDLSKITPDAPVKLAKSYYQIVSAGYDGADGLRLLEVATKAATAGVTTTEVAADGLTTAMNAWRLSMDEADQVADAMFKTVELGKTSFDQLSASMSRAASIAAATGISYNEVLAAVATLTKQGIPTAEAFTQIRASIVGLNKALGDGWSETLTLQNALGILNDRAGGSQVKLQEMVGSIEAVNAVLAIAGKNLEGANQDLRDISDSAGSAETAFRRMAGSNVNQWTIFGNRVTAITKGIGQSLLEMSSGIAEYFNKLLEGTSASEKLLRQEADQLTIVQSKLQDANVSTEEKKKLIDQLKASYPQHLQNIKNEGIYTDELANALGRVNSNITEKIRLQRLEERAAELFDPFEQAESALTSAADNLRLFVAREGAKFGIDAAKPLEEQIKALEQAYKDSGQFIAQGAGAAGPGAGQLPSVPGETLTRLQNELSFAEKAYKEAKDNIDSIQESIDAAMDRLSGVPAEVRKVFDEIRKITSDQYKENENIFDQYLFKNIPEKDLTENQKMIRDFAKNQIKLINTSFSGGGAGDKTFEDFLSEMRKKYEEYEANVTLIGKEEADERFNDLLKQGKDYGQYLQNLLSQTKGFAEQNAIILEGAGIGLDLNRTPQQAANELTQQGVNLEFTIDTTSIQYIRRQIQLITEEWEKANEADRPNIEERRKYWEERLRLATNGANTEKNIYSDIRLSLSDLNLRQLREYVNYWKERLKQAKKGSDEEREITNKIDSGINEIGDRINQTMSDISGALSEAGSIFRKFGNEDIAGLLDQLSGVASGVGSIAAGIASGNIFQAAQGGLQALTSLISVGVDSETPKFEKAIKRLEKAIDRLDQSIARSVGEERISGRLEAIDQLAELENQAEAAAKAEAEARKEVKLLGITVGKKGKGSGTDQAKLEELEQKAEDARRQAEELRDQLDELYTGTTQETIVDSIISGLKEGKKSVADFANDFESLMQDAMLRAFQTQYLEKEIAKFYDQFAAAGSDSEYTPAELASLRALYNSIITGAQDDIEAINEILEGMGFDALGTGQQRQGLSGAISTITEDTANILAGTLNAIRLDVANGVSIAQQSAQYLAIISQGITAYLPFLESIDMRLGRIEQGNLQIGAQG